MVFKPGQSGNPGGRPVGKVKQISAKAREHAEAAIEELAHILGDKLASHRDKIAAARELLDRGVGKSLAISTSLSGGPLEEMNEDELRDLIDNIRTIKAGHAGKASPEGAPDKTRH